MPHTSSRRRYEAYRAQMRVRLARMRRDGAVVSRQGTERSLRRSRSFGALLREFLRLLGPSRRSLALALGTLTVSTLLGLVPPAATKFAIDNVFGGAPLAPSVRGLFPESWTTLDTPRGLLVALAVGMIALTAVRMVIGLWGRWLATRTVKRVQNAVRRLAFGHAADLPLHRLQSLKSGGLVSMLREDAGGVGDLVFSMVYNPWRAIIQLLGSLAVLAYTDWRLLLGSVLLLPMVWFTHRTWIARIRPLHRDIKATRDAIDGHATETFSGIRVVRGFARTAAERNRYAEGSHLMARQEINVWWWSRGIEVVWEIMIPVASALLLWYGGMQVLEGTLTTGDLILFLTYLVMLLGPLEALATSATNFQASLAGLDRVLDLVAEPAELPDRAGALMPVRSEIRGRVEVRDVRFSYPGAEREVLRGVSLVAEPGQMVALVGASGSGKTTLCNLIARFSDPTDGAILLDGTDLRDLRLAGYRQLLGIVEQDVFLFDGTVAENIAYARRDASDEQIREAARIAFADRFIEEMPEGYATVIGERGVRLSGGQRQRIAIARAVLADPRILILDEATSNLDSESERFIQAALATLMRSRTSFVIAHRLSTIQHADRIVVIRDGLVDDQGTHAELMERSGHYRHMVALQTAPPIQLASGAVTNS
jgi:ATP-binding cassette subfamily B protein/subfamily B ATP-binding cassette protein MsbA